MQEKHAPLRGAEDEEGGIVPHQTALSKCYRVAPQSGARPRRLARLIILALLDPAKCLISQRFVTYVGDDPAGLHERR